MKRSAEAEAEAEAPCPFCDEIYLTEEERSQHIEIAHKNKIVNKVRHFFFFLLLHFSFFSVGFVHLVLQTPTLLLSMLRKITIITLTQKRKRKEILKGKNSVSLN